MDETTLVLGVGTRPTHLTKDGRLAVEDDSERIVALLSVAGRRPVSSAVLGPIEAAAFHWRCGDKALANQAGKRLTTTAEQSPPEFDLQLPKSPLV